VSLDKPEEREKKDAANQQRKETLNGKGPRKFPGSDVVDDTLVDVRCVLLLLLFPAQTAVY
jgi:hypothetical protein